MTEGQSAVFTLYKNSLKIIQAAAANLFSIIFSFTSILHILNSIRCEATSFTLVFFVCHSFLPFHSVILLFFFYPRTSSSMACDYVLWRAFMCNNANIKRNIFLLLLLLLDADVCFHLRLHSMICHLTILYNLHVGWVQSYADRSVFMLNLWSTTFSGWRWVKCLPFVGQ